MLNEAKTYMEMGWAVFPVKGKIPTTENGVLDATADPAEAVGWFNGGGIGLATGKPSGVWAVDLDSEDAVVLFRKMKEENDDESETVVSKTRRGYHILFQMPDDVDVRNSAGMLGEGIDVRGTGGYIIVPPSPHPDGGSYRWARSPFDVGVAPAPEWLIAKLTPKKRELSSPVGNAIAEGRRNATLASLAGSLRRRGASLESIYAALSAENEVKCHPPLPENEVQAIAESVGRYDPEQKMGLELIDYGVAARIKAEKLKPLSVVGTPWDSWNRVCLGAGGGEGLAHGWHVIVGAKSGSGKSLLAMNMAASAVRNGEDVCLISLEMSQSENLSRLLSIYTGESDMSLGHGQKFDAEKWDASAMELFEAGGSIRINDSPIANLAQITDAIERHVDDGCRTFIIDYLQLAWVRNAETMLQQITEVSHGIRGLAQKHEVVTIGLSQINRQMSYSGSIRKEGLLGGSSLENDADQVVLVTGMDRQDAGYQVTLELDKNRHGPGIEWDVFLNTRNLRMTEMLPDELPSRTL